MSDSNPPRADATPVKDFFINILTQDVELLHTIPEFVDNSIDGAVRRSNSSTDYSEFYVSIVMDSDHLEVTDNCGGIPLDVASDYAFRFGRPEGLEDVLPTKIGEFGIGMKRSLFKIGSHFIVESKTDDTHYVIEVNVSDWRDSDDWNFPIEFIDDTDSRAELPHEGTRICVTELRDEPQKKFAAETFESELAEELTSRNREYLDNGFGVILNRQNLAYREMNIFESDEISPAYEEFTFHGEDGDVDVKIVCGIGERSNDEGGWYVFCNGRLVLEADQSETTGWGTNSGEKIPKFHGQFNRFRGLVYFESDTPGTLPWNTTKTGVNQDSAVFQKARQNMLSLARPVIDFLNEVENQKRDQKGDEKPELEQRVEQATLTDITEVSSTRNQKFTGPDPEKEPEEDDGPVMKNVSYSAEKDRLERAKEYFEVDSYSKVGQASFEYFWTLEDLEE